MLGEPEISKPRFFFPVAVIYFILHFHFRPNSFSNPPSHPVIMMIRNGSACIFEIRRHVTLELAD